MRKKHRRKHKKKNKIFSFKGLAKLVTRLLNFALFSFKVIFVLLIILLISSKFILSFVDSNNYKDDISHYINENINARVVFNGPLEWDLISPNPKLVFNNVVVKKDIEFFNAKKIKVELSLWDLFFGKVSLSNLEIYEGAFFIEEDILNSISSDKTTDFIFPVDKEKNIFDSDVEQCVVENASSEGIFEEFIDELKFSFDNILIYNFKFIFNEKVVRVDALALKNRKFKTNVQGVFDYNKQKIKVDFNTNEVEKIVENILNDGEIYVDGVVLLNGARLKTLFKVGNVFSNIRVVGKLNFISEDVFSNLKSFDIKSLYLPILKANTNFIYSKNYFALSDLSLKLGDSDLSGNIKGEFNNERPNFQVELFSENFNLEEVLQYERSAVSNLEKIVKKDSELNAFKDVPLFADFFNSFNLNADLDFKSIVTYDTLEVANLKTNFVLNNGFALLENFKANIADGSVDLKISTDVSDGKNLKTSLDLNVFDVNVGKIISQVGYKDFMIGGNSQAQIVLDSFGSNLEELMANLNGSVRAKTDDSMFVDELGLEAFTSDLLTTTLNVGTDAIKDLGKKVNKVFTGKVDKRKKKEEIYCIATNLNIKNGKSFSNRGLAMEAEKFNMVIDGFVDFKKEKMDISIIPVRKKGLNIVTLSPLDLIAIRGSLSAPQIVVDQDSLTKTAGEFAFLSLVLAPMTGATSLIAAGVTTVFAKSLLDEVGKDKRPCRTAWKGVGKSVKKNVGRIIINDIETEEDSSLIDKDVDVFDKAKSAIKKDVEKDRSKSLSIENEMNNNKDVSE